MMQMSFYSSLSSSSALLKLLEVGGQTDWGRGRKRSLDCGGAFFVLTVKAEPPANIEVTMNSSTLPAIKEIGKKWSTRIKISILCTSIELETRCASPKLKSISLQSAAVQAFKNIESFLSACSDSRVVKCVFKLLNVSLPFKTATDTRFADTETSKQSRQIAALNGSRISSGIWRWSPGGLLNVWLGGVLCESNSNTECFFFLSGNSWRGIHIFLSDHSVHLRLPLLNEMQMSLSPHLSLPPSPFLWSLQHLITLRREQSCGLRKIARERKAFFFSPRSDWHDKLELARSNKHFHSRHEITPHLAGLAVSCMLWLTMTTC